MAENIHCYKIHADLSRAGELNNLIEDVARLGNLIFDQDSSIVVWLDDDVGKDDLMCILNQNGIKEYYCEPITYKMIGKENSFNFFSAWFVDNYRASQIREAESKRQSELRQMYDNIQRAQFELDKLTGVNKTSTINNNISKEAPKDVG